MNKSQLSIFIISLFYFFGIIGIAIPASRNLFAMATPLTLLLSLALVLYNHEHWNKPFIYFSIFCGLVGYFSEVVGVTTGLVFGEYSYGQTLGWQILDVPVILSVNWLLLIYTSAAVCSFLFGHFNLILKAAISAALMVSLDFLIEPIAISLDFWSWKYDTIPLQNYLGWFVIAFLLQLVFLNVFNKAEKNRVAIILFGWQIIFFGVLNLFL
jgi:putative membrane protein